MKQGEPGSWRAYNKLPPGRTITEIMHAATDDRGAGFCLVCGDERDGFTEPDAENYPCSEPECGNHVFGAEQILIMFVP